MRSCADVYRPRLRYPNGLARLLGDPRGALLLDRSGIHIVDGISVQFIDEVDLYVLCLHLSRIELINRVDVLVGQIRIVAQGILVPATVVNLCAALFMARDCLS